ncbi:MAG: SAM-dependent methyltransferase [Chthoniobacteraceae bacterium]
MPIDSFLEKFSAALEAGTFVKLTLSDPRPSVVNQQPAPLLRNVYGRIVQLRGEAQVSLVWHYATRDETKNYPFSRAPEVVRGLIEESFESAHLFCTNGDWRWRRGRALKASRPTFGKAPAPDHDRRKMKAVEGAAWLTALGVTDRSGEARPGMADKLRQIERFVELLGHQVAGSSLAAAKELRAADLGAGKGYLTFAAYDFFRKGGAEIQMVGVEARSELVELTNRVAREVGFDGLRFERGEIADFQPEADLDLLVALHACNTATDDALHLGIRSKARLILAAPCCHQEVRPQLAPDPILDPIVRHGILAEREAELLTDALRALLLEMHGYRASVFEFISPEHTAKNVMIAAHRRMQPSDPERPRAQLRALMEFHGIKTQRLARLLGEC